MEEQLLVEMKESVDKSEHFNSQGRADEVERDCWETILLEEGHQESKTNEDHDMDILEH